MSGCGGGSSSTSNPQLTYEVDLSWSPPANSPDPVAGYNVYRISSNDITFQQLNSSLVVQTNYVDSTVQNGQSYYYLVESVDASGVPSDPSNTAMAVIP